MKAKCDNCSKSFEYKQHTQSVNGVDVLYSECPHCGQRGLINVIDDELKKLIQVTKELREEHANASTSEEEERVWNKIEASYKKTNKLAKEKESEYSEIIEDVIL